MSWPDTRLLDLLNLELPIIQAPMAGANDAQMAAAVCQAGGLGSLPCAMLSADALRTQIGIVRQQTDQPLNLNFFCHTPARADPAAEARWRKLLRPHYEALGLDPDLQAPAANRAPFDDRMCGVVEAFQPGVVSFHFGLPAPELLERVKQTGARVLSSATTVAEAIWLEQHGCDAVIAQGAEAGGHRGIFLSDDVQRDIASQPGTFALVPQVVDAVGIPVIAAGGIADARGVVAAFALGASGVQIGTAYLATPEATISDLHRHALDSATDESTTLTNLFSGRPARGIVNKLMRELGPMSRAAPPFPTAGGALAPLKAAAEKQGRGDYSSLWAGQAAGLARQQSAGQLTRSLAEQTLALFRQMGSG